MLNIPRIGMSSIRLFLTIIIVFSSFISICPIANAETIGATSKNVRLKAEDLSFGKNSELVEDDGQTVLKTQKINLSHKEEFVLSNIFLKDLKDQTTPVPYVTSIKAKFVNIDENLDRLEPTFSIEMYNPATKKIRKKIFRNYEAKEYYQDLSFITLATTKGMETVSVKIFGNADVYISEINYNEVSRTTQDTKEELPFIDALRKPFLATVDSEYAIVDTNSKGIFYELPKNNYCLISDSCDIKITFESEDKSLKDNEKLFTIFYGQDGANRKATRITHIYAGEFKETKFETILEIPKEDYAESTLSIFSYGNATIKFYKPEFAKSGNTDIELISRKGLDLGRILTLDTKEAKGANGSLLDIIQSKDELNGKYEFKFNIKKLENYTSGKDLLKIEIVDDIGKNLTGKTNIIDENDLEFNKETNISIPFEAKRVSKVYISIHFYGNHLGARSDMEVSKFEVKRS